MVLVDVGPLENVVGRLVCAACSGQRGGRKELRFRPLSGLIHDVIGLSTD